MAPWGGRWRTHVPNVVVDVMLVGKEPLTQSPGYRPNAERARKTTTPVACGLFPPIGGVRTSGREGFGSQTCAQEAGKHSADQDAREKESSGEVR